MKQKIFFNNAKTEDALRKCKVVITDDILDSLYGGLLPKNKYIIRHGEQSKNIETVMNIVNALMNMDVGRDDMIGAFGGGVVGDIAGFVASIYKRGIRWINVPTSLIAMVDSSIGGKTAINFGSIKNMLGTYWMPDTYIDTRYLRSLPPREMNSGMGEIVKTALLDEKLYGMMQSKCEMDDIIQRCITVKSEICERDPYDANERRSLNIGHTVGHAIEINCGLSHGESVLFGLRTEMLMFRDEIADEFLYEAQAFINDYVHVDLYLSAQNVANIAKYDKKNKGGISVIYPYAIGKTREAKLSQSEFVRKLKDAL